MTPDCRRIVVVGLIGVPPVEGRTVSGSGGGNMTLDDLVDQHKMIVYDMATKQEELYVRKQKVMVCANVSLGRFR